MAEPGSAGILPANNILILGVGNPYRRDDGIGPAVIAHLQADPLADGIDLLDGGTDGLALLEEIKKYAHVLIIDAVQMGKIPGEVCLFSPEEAKLTVATDALSTHGFGLAEVIGLMEKLEIKTDLRIIGIQAQDLSFGEEMSQDVSSKIEEICDLVKTYLVTSNQLSVISHQ